MSENHAVGLVIHLGVPFLCDNGTLTSHCGFSSQNTVSSWSLLWKPERSKISVMLVGSYL